LSQPLFSPSAARRCRLQHPLSGLSPSVRSGEIRYREDVAEGLETAPRAFINMLAGRNFGKTLVRVS
jgi:NADPH-dependent curcumin reductase CurA